MADIILREQDIPPDLAEYFEPLEFGRLTNVFTINPYPYKEAHFATFPPKLVEPCIKAGTSEKCCPECGKPWERMVEKELKPQYESRHGGFAARGDASGMVDMSKTWKPGSNQVTTLGWRPGCSHGHDPIPCIVLDPFVGSGTSVMVALRLGRRAIGIDLSESYCEMARRRIIADNPMFNGPGEATE